MSWRRLAENLGRQPGGWRLLNYRALRFVWRAGLDFSCRLLPLRANSRSRKDDEDQVMRIKIKKSRKEKKGQTNWPAPYRWAAMGTLAVYSAAGSKFVPAAFAQSQPAQTAASAASAEG